METENPSLDHLDATTEIGGETSSLFRRKRDRETAQEYGMPGYIDVYAEKEKNRGRQTEEEVEEAKAAARLNITPQKTQYLLDSIAEERSATVSKTAPLQVRPGIKLRVDSLMRTWVISYSNAVFKSVYDICYNIENEVKVRRIFPPRPKIKEEKKEEKEEEPLQVWFYCDENHPTYQMSIAFTKDTAKNLVYYASHYFEDRK